MALTDHPAHAYENMDDDARRIFEALADEQYDFRTVEGIAEDTQLSPSEVERTLIKHWELVRLSPVPGPNREALYTLRSRPVSARERLALAQSVVASPVS